MADMMAIVSKAVFEQILAQNSGADVGSKLGIDRYLSTHKLLSPLGEGGSLFLMTVRPPDEQLWLVGILEAPALKKDGWYASPSTAKIADLSTLKAKLQTANGKGINAKPGALAMSLQTPRGLTDADAELLRAAAGGSTAGSTKKAEKKAEKKEAPKKAEAPKKKSSATASTGGSPLSALQRAMEEEDGEAALLAALACWRETRSPALGDLVDAISARVSGAPVTDQNAWSQLAATKDPRVLGQLLPSVTSLPVSLLPSAADMLGKFELDPRLAIAGAKWALEPPTTSSSTYPFWTKLLDAVGRIGDPRTKLIMKRRLGKPQGSSQFWPKFYTALERAVAKVATFSFVALDERALEKLSALVPKLSEISAAASVATPSAAAAAAEEIVELTGPPIARAATHLEAGRTVAAIDALLEAWREKRLPDIADVIDRTSRLLPSWERRLCLATKDIHELWMAAFESDPRPLMPQLLDFFNATPAGMSERHLVALASLPDDPRISLRLAEMSCRYGGSASPERTQFWKSLFEILARTRDVRTCGPILAQFKDFTGEYYNHHRQGRRIVGPFVFNPQAAFGAWPLDRGLLDQKEAKALQTVEKLLDAAEKKQDRSELRLLDAIADDWKDPAPRLVYADWLSERNNPLGELIVLQCQEKLTPAQAKRKKELAGAWHMLGHFSELVTWQDKTSELPKDVRVDTYAGTLTWRKLRGHRLLSIVETLAFDEYSQQLPTAQDLAGVMLHADTKRLREVTQVRAELGDALEPLVKEVFRREGLRFVRA